MLFDVIYEYVEQKLNGEVGRGGGGGGGGKTRKGIGRELHSESTLLRVQ